eukprot:CAMPEP_0177649274 /NCGR_PEP_ID=MMETSP0447-20121125/11292_1 /TAXON_ID=0 /ORGANISM="Stygamoeba regulata, Strain BSH-02190019" /LENGTH=283 /DNA_ID=CAMNT_0019152007 /DNA_START=262 /DNA_END=1109 /DNA_ORIENTATION=+
MADQAADPPAVDPPAETTATESEPPAPTTQTDCAEDAPTPILPSSEPPPGPCSTTYASVKDVGVAADRNARHRRYMEDAHTFIDRFFDDDGQAFFGVYDGHGGKQAALYCQQNFHEFFKECLAEYPPDKRTDENLAEVMRAAFAKTDAEMKPNVGSSCGACAVVSVILRDGSGNRKLLTGNAGDARAVLLSNGEAVTLTRDHKASNEEEEKRIIDVGGFVRNGRVNATLAVTRALGDHCMKQFIISEPNVTVRDLTPSDSLLLLACDGVWDVLTVEDACKLCL